MGTTSGYCDKCEPDEFRLDKIVKVGGTLDEPYFIFRLILWKVQMPVNVCTLQQHKPGMG